VIHLLAEFVENATIFSPPNTEVRVTGELVAKGFAIDIEDRGLGMDDEEFAGINASLANPPLFDPSGSDRFGLFVGAQLARRHGIRAKLRRSDYGGVTAIVLIPLALVVPANALGDGRTSGQAPNTRLTTASREVTAPPANGNGSHAATPLTGDWPAPPPNGDRPAAPAAWELTPASPAPEVPRPRHTHTPTPAPDPPEPYAGLDAEPPSSPVATDPGDAPPPGSRFGLTENGLPQRIRQTSLAPQLRKPTAPPPAPGPAATPRSPETARNVMSAFQRGWRRGLADGEQDQLTDLTDLPQERE
jgi:hypothetical protein